MRSASSTTSYASFPGPAPGSVTGLDVSIIVPLYNERENLAELDQQLRAAMAATDAVYEVIYIDDGSSSGDGDF